MVETGMKQENHTSDGKLSPMQADDTTNASSPGMTSSKNRVPYPVTSVSKDVPPVKEYTHHKKAMITSSTGNCNTPRCKSASPVSIVTSQMTPYTPSDSEMMSPDSGMSSASSSPDTPTDDNNNTIRPAVSQSGTPLAPPGGAPFKRRPGRPPGSTKRFKNPYTREYRRKSDSDNSNDFSLRKFFEAGGRDYNEYLDWLKKRGHPQNNGVAAASPAAYPAMVPTSVSSSPSQSYPARPQALPHSHPSGHQSTQPPVSQPHILPPGYRPILIPRTPLPPFMPSFAMVPMPGQPLPSQLSPPVPKDGFSALDLSAKRRRSDPLPDEFESRMLRDERLRTESIRPDFIKQESIRPESRPELRHELRMDMSRVEREEPSSPTKSPAEGGEVESSTPEVDVTTWDVENVVKFVTSVPGCLEYADTFREHKIDGATLPHLSESHLLNFVKMKLGPAIRLRLAISRLQAAN